MDNSPPVAVAQGGAAQQNNNGSTLAQEAADVVDGSIPVGPNHNRKKRSFDIVGLQGHNAEPANKIHSPIQELPIDPAPPSSLGRSRVMPQQNVASSSVSTQQHFGTGPSKEMREHRNGIMRILKENMVHDLVPASGTCIVFDSELPVRSAFHALQEQHLVAAPIWDSSSQRLIGMLTVTTFIEILLHYCDQNNHVNTHVGNESIKHWLEVLGRFKEGLITLDPDASLYKACEHLRKYRVHRLPVVEEGDDQCVLYVVTHLKMLKYLLTRLDGETMMQNSLGDLQVGTFSNVVTCQMHTCMAKVLRLLYQNNITALPVVDDEGVVLNLLARVDVLCVAREQMYHDLNITVAQTIALRQKHATSASPELHTCRRTDSLLAVFQKLAANNTHRLIVVDELGKLEGVVSLSDMFHLFLA